MANWFSRLITRNKDLLGIEEVIPSTGGASTAGAFGSAAASITDFLRSFTGKTDELMARSNTAEQATGYGGGFLASFTSTAKAFGPMLLLIGGGILILVLAKKIK